MALFVSTLILQLLCIFFNYFHYGVYSNLGKKYYLGEGTSFNVSRYPGYKNFTKDNFIIGANASVSQGLSVGPTGTAIIGGSIYTVQTGSCQYDSDKGILTIKPYILGLRVSGSEQTVTLKMFAYLIT